MVNEKPNKQPLPQLAPGAPQPGPTLLQPSLPSLPLACAVALLHLPSPCASTSLTAQPAPWLAHWSFLHRIANKPSPSFLLLLSSRAFLPIFSCLDLTFPPLLTSVLAISRSAPPHRACRLLQAGARGPRPCSSSEPSPHSWTSGRVLGAPPGWGLQLPARSPQVCHGGGSDAAQLGRQEMERCLWPRSELGSLKQPQDPGGCG